MSPRPHRPPAAMTLRPLASCARAFAWLGAPLASLLLASHAWAQASRDEEELAASFGDRVVMQSPEFSIATGRSQSLRRAPAVASVVTAEDISRIGATDLNEVMETVPGVHVTRNIQGHTPPSHNPSHHTPTKVTMTGSKFAEHSNTVFVTVCAPIRSTLFFIYSCATNWSNSHEQSRHPRVAQGPAQGFAGTASCGG